MTDRGRARDAVATTLSLAAWAYLVWVVLTWTRTLEQLAFGAAFALVVAVALAPLGPAAGPWWFLTPRRLATSAWLVLSTAARVARANAQLTARIWDPRRPLTSGMIVVATHERSDGDLAAVGLISSLVVDKQIVDLDRRHRHLQYHALAVPEGSRRAARLEVNGPVEDLIDALKANDE